MSITERTTWRRALRVLSVAAAAAVIGASVALSSRSTVAAIPGLSADATAVVGHVALYGLLAAVVWVALMLWHVPSRPRLAVAFFATVAYGVADEIHQRFVPGRTASLADLAVDAIAAGGVLLCLWRLEGVLPPHAAVPRQARGGAAEPAPGGHTLGGHRPLADRSSRHPRVEIAEDLTAPLFRGDSSQTRKEHALEGPNRSPRYHRR